MEIQFSPQETKAFTAAIAEELMKRLAPRLEALERAMGPRTLVLPEPKPHTACQEKTPKALESAHLDRDEVATLIGVSKSTVRRMENKGEFPRRIQLTSGRVAWRRSEVMVWMTERRAA